MKYATYIVLALIAMLMVTVFIMCIITPEKTSFGEYTDPIKYWTSDAYVRNNFEMKGI